MSTKQSFHEWLKSGDNIPFQTMIGENPRHQELFAILRLPINEAVDLLVYRRSFGERFDYSCTSFDCGTFYQRETDTLFEIGYGLEYLIKNTADPSIPNIGPGVSDVEKEIQLKLNTELAHQITKKEDLPVVDLDEQRKRDLSNVKQYAAAQEARRLYLGDQTPQDKQYIVAPSVDDCYYESFIAYITNPDKYIQDTLEELLADEDHQREFLYQLLVHEAVVKEYNALLENKQSDTHLIKRIMTAMYSCPEAKTVTVAILKEGHEFSFKTDARVLLWDTNNYSQYYIAAQDRRKFTSLFGTSADYHPAEIQKIIYRGKPLYSKS